MAETTLQIAERIFKRAREMREQGEYSTEAGEIIRLYEHIAEVAMRLAALEMTIRQDLRDLIRKAVGRQGEGELLPPSKPQ